MQPTKKSKNNRETVQLTMDGYTATVPAELFKGLSQAEEARLGLAIMNTQRALILELARHQEVFIKVYRSQGENPFCRVTGVMLAARYIANEAIESADKTILAPYENHSDFLAALETLDHEFRFRAEFIFQLMHEFGAEPPRKVQRLFCCWRQSVNRLVEHFYPAALKVYWESKRLATDFSDDAFSDAFMLIIKCAERFNPSNGSFISFFTVYQRYSRTYRDNVSKHEIPEDDINWEVVQSLGLCDESMPFHDPGLTIEAQSLQKYIQALIRKLSINERLVVDNSFGISHHSIAQKDLAEDLGLSNGRLSQLKRSALASLKRMIENENPHLVPNGRSTADEHEWQRFSY